MAASRLIFAVARDGVLPFSGWVSRVSPTGQPQNAIIVVWAVASLVTCTILPSGVAFTSLISAAGVPSAAAYGLICFGRVFLTPNTFPKPKWNLGQWSRPFQIAGIVWNAWVIAVLFSPYIFPVTGASLNCEEIEPKLPFFSYLPSIPFASTLPWCFKLIIRCRCTNYHGRRHYLRIDFLLANSRGVMVAERPHISLHPERRLS